MKKYILLLLSAAIGLALSANSASAITITPTGTYFGSLPEATFNGTGIPTYAVQVTKIGDLTIGTSITARYGNSALTNDAHGTFTCPAGGDTLNGAPTLAKWNFDYYVEGISFGQTTRLYYDNNPAVGNDVTSFYPGFGFNYQDSQNLGFAAFNGGSFNPNYNGDYAFAVVAYNIFGSEIGRSAVIARVTNGTSPTNPVPDGGSTALLLSGGLSVMGLLSFRSRRNQKCMLT
jgi:hypothetical protein